MSSTFVPGAELHINPAEEDAAQRCRLVYAVAAGLDHDRAGHVECGKRMLEVLKALADSKLTAEANPGEVVQLQSIRPASDEELTVLHTPTHLGSLRQRVAKDAPCIIADFEEAQSEVTYITPSSFEDAAQAAGAALAVVDAVAADRSSATPKGFALIRPPGHHAGADTPTGFCLLNNVALAARYAQQRHGFPKVMVVDFDVHHGNGTQDLFYGDPSVLFIDMHERDVWPGSGQAGERGAGEGEGYTINVPLPVGSGHQAACLAMQRIVAPAARRFHPDFMLVSAGFDAHWRDPLEKLNYQSATYHALLTSLHDLADELCGGRLVVLLEGGYSLQGLSEGVCEAFLSLLGRPSAQPHDAEVPAEPLDAGVQAIEEVAALHSLHHKTSNGCL